MKIFCVGFQKTGTTSMGAALSTLGYSVVGARGSQDPRISETAYNLVEEFLPKYDAFQDNPWAVLYEHLDRMCPDSKFILTTRDPDSWLESAIHTFGNSTSPMREWIYGFGDPIGHEDVYFERYMRHNADVIQYFSGRGADRFLVMSLEEGDGWDKLCSFLGVPIVQDKPFPHRNNSEEKRRFKWRARRLFRKVRRRLS